MTTKTPMELADEIESLNSKAIQGPWSSKILRDYRGVSGSNDTPYIYGPPPYNTLLMGLWPIHLPEETAAVEQTMSDTLEFICELRNSLPEIISALRQSARREALLRRWTEAEVDMSDPHTTELFQDTVRELRGAEERAKANQEDAERYRVLRQNTGKEYVVATYGVPHALRITFDANGCEKYLPDGALDFPKTLDAILDDEKKIRGKWIHGPAARRGKP